MTTAVQKSKKMKKTGKAAAENAEMNKGEGDGVERRVGANAGYGKRKQGEKEDGRRCRSGNDVHKAHPRSFSCRVCLTDESKDGEDAVMRRVGQISLLPHWLIGWLALVVERSVRDHRRYCSIARILEGLVSSDQLKMESLLHRWRCTVRLWVSCPLGALLACVLRNQIGSYK